MVRNPASVVCGISQKTSGLRNFPVLCAENASVDSEKISPAQHTAGSQAINRLYLRGMRTRPSICDN